MQWCLYQRERQVKDLTVSKVLVCARLCSVHSTIKAKQQILQETIQCYVSCTEGDVWTCVACT